jgi:dienelactone hydrolase
VRATILLSSVLLAGVAGAQAIIPCPDEPGLDGLACQVATLGVAADTAAQRLLRARAACVAGRTSAAARELRGMRRALASLGDQPDVLLADALRRATIDRLRRQPCPELIEVLRPRRHELVHEGELFVLLRLAPDADPATLSVRLDDDAPATFTPGSVSTTQAWLRLPCATGHERLRVTARSRDGARTDTETVPIACGGDHVLGAEVESLIAHDYVAERLRVVPVRPLRGGATYALVATRGLRTSGGRVHASAAFRAAAGLPPRAARGVEAIFTDDPLDARNPFPSQRLVRPDDTVVIPDGFSARGLPPLPRLDGVRAFLRRLDHGSEEHHGFSPNTVAVVGFDAPLRLDDATADRLFLVEVEPGTDLPALLDALERERGLDRRRVAVASVFPVEDLPGELGTIRAQIRSRPAPAVDFTDPDPDDGRAFGVFHPGDSAFGAFFGGNPPAPVGAMVRASFPSPDYREAGRFPARFLDGSAVPPGVAIDFLLALPARGTPPYPAVVVQHGFGGDNGFVAQLAGDFTAAGLAVIGIPAPEHGPRGNFIDFFDFDDFNAFGNNFRQASVDLLALVRLLEAGLDVDGDGEADVRGDALGYLGQSLGGVIGGVFTAVEPTITTAVLNVPGGKLSQLAGAVSPLAEPFLARFATEAGIPVHVCGGDPTATACTGSAACAPGVPCTDNPDFTALLDAAALDFQTQLDPGDGAAYAGLLRLEPRGLGPKPVLVQEGIGDTVVANPLTEALARAIALPANRADEAAGGVAGLWRFPPPAGHGILALPAVRAQAVRFLASGGTNLAP